VSRLQDAIEAGQKLGRLALYFGCWRELGHYLHDTDGNKVLWRDRPTLRLPWSDALMDSSLLKNGKRPDIYDGKVFWTAGGADVFWYASYWWDNSIDKRPGSNSGFYVRGFGHPEAQQAFDYACAQFPKIVARQAHPLILQNPA
jgi:hypothetical protein